MRLAQRRTSCPSAIALLLAVTTARAEPPPAPAAGAGASDEQRADALLEQAKALFREGEYRQALPLVEQAHALVASPRSLFNLGVLHHKLAECVPARDHFELYLQREPAGVARPHALAALEELHARCPATAPEPIAPLPPAPFSEHGEPAAPRSALRAPAAPRRWSVEPLAERSPVPGAGALLLLGLGTAAGIGSLLSLAAQSRAQQDIDALGPRAARADGGWDAFEGQRRDLAGNGRLYCGVAIGLGAAGLALLGTGATVWMLELDDAASPLAAGAGVGYRGRF